MRNGNFLFNEIHRIPTFRFNFYDAITIAIKYKKYVELARKFRMYALILSSAPELNPAPEPNPDPIFQNTPLSPDILKFLESLDYILFKSRIKKNVIHEYFMREYLRIIFDFTVSSTREKVEYALFNLFGDINLSREESECFSFVVSFMKNYTFSDSQLKFFQKEVEGFFVSSSDVSFKQKIRENDTFWNILIFVIHMICDKEVFSSWNFLLK